MSWGKTIVVIAVGISTLVISLLLWVLFIQAVAADDAVCFDDAGVQGVYDIAGACVTPQVYAERQSVENLLATADQLEALGYDLHAEILRQGVAHVTETNPLRRITSATTTRPAATVAETLFGIAPDDPLLEVWDRPSPLETYLHRYFHTEDVTKAYEVVRCETGGTFDPNITNRGGSGASGWFQHMPQYWEERSTAAGFDGYSIFDPDANVAVAAWLVYNDGWGHWPICGR